MLRGKPSLRRTAAGVLLFFILTAATHAQNFTGGFSFFLPPTDTSATRFVPAFPRSPIMEQDFITIDGNGRFSIRGTPVRFFGANFAADAAFPTPSKAWFVAGRLRKMGFNLVRFHHLDNPWGQGSLFTPGTTTRQLNPISVDRLENLIAEIKQNGLYACMGLHVSRTFNNLDGIPDADSLQEYGKAINYFDPQILFLHKEFARQLLTHVSPYTGTTMASDPVLAMVELTNENSLYRYWRDGKLKHITEGGILTARHVRMLDSVWMAYLHTRYASTTDLTKTWNAGASASGGSNTIVNGTFETAPPSTGWVMEIHAPARAVAIRDTTTRNSGNASARVDVTQVDGIDWHLQWKQVNLSVKQDSTYVVSFAARSDAARSIPVALQRDNSPYTWYGGMTAQLTPEWKTYTFSVRAPEDVGYAVRLSFTVGVQTGSYWFDDITMTMRGPKGMLDGESLETGSVRRIDYAECSGFTDARVRDLSSFYLKLEEDYYTTMREYLRDSLHVRVPILGTNWNVGPATLSVQSQFDYIDNHAYWDHPSFPHEPWSPTDWVITNTPMVQATDGGTIPALMAGVPVEGKPFTISEYNHPFPNRYQSEGMLFISSYASFHDADGIMIFDYNASNDWETDKIATYFSIHRNPAMMALVPSCAAAFRTGMISPARTKVVINYAPDDYLTLPRRDNATWYGPSLVNRALALKNGIRAGSFTSPTPFNPLTVPPAPTSPFETDTREIFWNPSGLFTVVTQRFVGTTGLLQNFSNRSLGPLTVKTASDFGTLTWLSLTSDSLQATRRSLLTVSSKAQNSGMIWDGLLSIHNNWGGLPTQVAPLTLSLRTHMYADSLRIFPLDPMGRETSEYTTLLPADANAFDLTIDQSVTPTMWFGIEAFGGGVVAGAGELSSVIPLEPTLAQNYPNPFNPKTVIRYTVGGVRGQGPEISTVRLVVYDLLGREVVTLVNERKDPGTYQATFDATGLSSGIYVYRLSSGAYCESRKMILTK